MNDKDVDYFISFLKNESSLISAHNFDEINALEEEKQMLCEQFSQFMERVLENWECLSVERRHHLRRMMSQVRQKLGENQKALMCAIDLHRQMIRVCLDAYAADHIKAHSYNALSQIRMDSMSGWFTTQKNI